MNQTSFLSLAHSKKLKCERFLDEMRRVIPWGKFLGKVLPHYTAAETGRKRKDVLMMLKIYFLQQWYHLSDPGVEEAIYDRNSFQKFLEIDLLSEQVPDETTILNFRHLLEEHELQKKFFQTVQEILIERGLMMKEGTIVDATIIAAPSSTKNQEHRRDPEMSSTKKGNEWHFGMKAHVGVDDESGLVHTLDTTTASVHDKAVMNELWHGEEKRKFGDKGYYDEEEKRKARREGVFWGILDRGKRGIGLSSSQVRRNKRFSSIRSKVEHPFQILNCQWGYVKTRYRGLLKNTLHLFTLFTLINLYRSRRTLLSAA